MFREMLLKCVKQKEGRYGLLPFVNYTSSQRGRDCKTEDLEGRTPSDHLDDLVGIKSLREIMVLLEKPGRKTCYFMVNA